jgi:hypothetical protein
MSASTIIGLIVCWLVMVGVICWWWAVIKSGKAGEEEEEEHDFRRYKHESIRHEKGYRGIGGGIDLV